MELSINVYDVNGNVVKTAKANTIKLKFGSIRAIMELLAVENLEDTSELMKRMYAAWGNLSVVLGQIFPDMNYEDWEFVDLDELLPVVYNILAYSFAQIMTIPKDPKN